MDTFDITNMSTHNNKDLDMSLDFKFGRSGDWRRHLKIGIFIILVTMIIKHQEFVEDGLAELLM